MNQTDEWLIIESLIAGLSELARKVKEIEDSKKPKVDEDKLYEAVTAGISQLQREIDELRGSK